jgi:FXSXX-COOH protein
MVELGRQVGSSLIDVTGLSLTDLAQLDAATLETALARLLPQHTHGSAADELCDGSKSRLWQNYKPKS